MGFFSEVSLSQMINSWSSQSHSNSRRLNGIMTYLLRDIRGLTVLKQNYKRSSSGITSSKMSRDMYFPVQIVTVIRLRYGRVPLTNYQAGAPMERVHIAFLGPLPRTANGNEHCLVMVDQFTKYVPLPSQKAEVTAKAAIDTLFSRFGYPFQLFSDQSRNFQSKVFDSVCKLLQIHKAKTTPYRPSSNGQCERFNRTLMDAVRCYIGITHNKWDEHVQQISGAIRASVNRSTGFTPNKLMLGREVHTPAQLMFPNVREKTKDVDQFVSHLSESIQKAHDFASSTLKTTSERMKRDYDLKVLLRPYHKGDVV